MYIDCLWVAGSFKGNGYSTDLLNACIEDSKAKGKKGICILSAAKKKPFLADPKFLKYKTLQSVMKQIMVFSSGICLFLWMRLSLNLRSVRSIHTLSRKAMYCTIPINVRLMQNMFRCLLEVAKEREVPFQAIRLETKEEAQNAPTPVTTYALFYNGEYVTNEQMNDKRFIKLLDGMEK